MPDGRYAIGGAPVLQLEETDAAPEFADCSGWLAADHPVTGPEKLVAAPWRVDGARPPLRAHAPALGSGNAHVLGGILGWSREQVRAMEAT